MCCTSKTADRFAEPEAIAQKMLKFAYQVGKENRPADNLLRNSCVNDWMLWDWEGTDQHPLGLEETDPIAALDVAEKEVSDVPNTK